MIDVYVGELSSIHRSISSLSNKVNMEVKYSKDITKEQFYGFFYKPSIYYFLYNKEQFTDSKYIDTFIANCINSDSYIICVVDDVIDKKSKFYKKCKDYITEFPTNIIEVNYKDMVLKDLSSIYNVENSKFVSVMYSLGYGKYAYQSGFVCNLILTGKISNIDIAKKLFILLCTMKG